MNMYWLIQDGKKMLENLKKLNHALSLFDCENTDDGDDDNNNNNNYWTTWHNLNNLNKHHL